MISPGARCRVKNLRNLIFCPSLPLSILCVLGARPFPRNLVSRQVRQGRQGGIKRGSFPIRNQHAMLHFNRLAALFSAFSPPLASFASLARDPFRVFCFAPSSPRTPRGIRRESPPICAPSVRCSFQQLAALFSALFSPLGVLRVLGARPSPRILFRAKFAKDAKGD